MFEWSGFTTKLMRSMYFDRPAAIRASSSVCHIDGAVYSDGMLITKLGEEDAQSMSVSLRIPFVEAEVEFIT